MPEDDNEDFNEALDALASASSTSHRPVSDVDAAPRPSAGRRPRASAKVTMDADRRLAGNAWCKRCQASLVGQTLDGQCQACGAPVTESVDTRQLGFADHAWLVSLFHGVNLMAVGSLIIIIFVCLSAGILGYFEGEPNALGLSRNTVDLLDMTCDIAYLLGSAVVYGLSVWIITKPRPDDLDENFPRGLPATARWMLIPALAINVFLGLAIMSAPPPPEGGAISLADIMELTRLPILFVLFAAWVVMMAYLMVLAKRVPNPRLAKSALHVTIALPATTVAGFVVLVLIAVAVGASADPGSALQGFMVGSCMFFLAFLAVSIWYLVVLFRYRRAFAGLAGVELPGNRKRR